MKAKPSSMVFKSNIGDMQDRYALAASLGQTFEGNRNLYELFGYEKSIPFKNYLALYNRQDIAKRVVDCLSNPIFNHFPEITSSNSVFDAQLELIMKTSKVQSYLSRLDILNRLGRYAVLVIGFDDGLPLEQPVQRAANLIYLRPYSEGSAEVAAFEKEPTNPRYGLPVFYKITTSNNKTIKIHHSRVLHVAEGTLEDDVYGISSLKPVYNRLMDLEKVVGGASEAFFMNASPGHVLMLDNDSIFDPGEKEDTQDQIDSYNMKLNKWLKLKGQKIETLATKIHSPKSTFDCIIALIAGTTAIPKRILIGSERAHLASEQDEAHWVNTIDDRRTIFVGPNMIIPFINILQKVGVLPEAEFEIFWPELKKVDEEQQVEGS